MHKNNMHDALQAQLPEKVNQKAKSFTLALFSKYGIYFSWYVGKRW